MSQITPLLLKQLEGYAALLLGTSLVETLREEEIDTFSILSLLSPTTRYNDLSKYIPRFLSPDICFNCHHDFGDTIGGRLRNGCPICQSTNHQEYSKVGVFILSTGLHPALADLIIARVIKNYL